MKWMNRILCMICIFLLTVQVLPAAAGKPSVSTDEAVYVNLDYYGTPTDASIVKGCSLNGNSVFEDYGSYEKVTNMSNHAEPQMTGEGVRWELPEGDGRFYYECKPSEEGLKMPWRFEISYKLNGVPAEAENLYGASGLVEINVSCVPNEEAELYYRNNMLLQVATMVNMQDTLSIEAPGAQVQSMGTYKAVVFAALPGEQTTFTIRIGSNHFESSGLIMMMIPGTLEQMKQIKQLKEAKDVVGDSAEGIYNSLDDILGILGSTVGGLQTMQSGMAGLNTLRGDMNASQDGIYDSLDDAVSDLTVLSAGLMNLVPHMQNAQGTVSDVAQDINRVVEYMNTVKKDINLYQTEIRNLQTEIGELQKRLTEFNDMNEWRKLARDRMVESISSLQNRADSLKRDINDLRTAIYYLERSLGELNRKIRNMPGISLDIPDSPIPTIGLITACINKIYDAMQETASHLNAQINTMTNSINDALDEARKVVDELINTLGSMNDMLGSISSACDEADGLSRSLKNMLYLVDGYFDILDSGTQDASRLMEELNKIGSTTQDLLQWMSGLTDQLSGLNDTLQENTGGVQSFLQDTEKLTGDLDRAIGGITTFINELESSLRGHSPQLNDATEQTLTGLIDVLQKGIEGMDIASSLQKTNRTVKDTVDTQIDKYDGENRLLHLDAEEEIPSFTSNKNPSPSSIQIILRTEEIDADSVNDNAEDLEPAAENVTLWNRIGNVFKKMWQAVTSVFGGE